MKTQKPERKKDSLNKNTSGRKKSEDVKKKKPYNTNDKSKKFKKDKPDSFDKENSFEKKEKKSFRKNDTENKTKKPYPPRKDEFKSSSKPSLKEKKVNDSGLIRLNKYIANAGICSRRDADVLIKSGNVTVNGVIVTELGVKVTQDDKISYDGKVLKNEKKVYLLLNKPKDYISTSDDPQKRRTVLTLIKGACKERIYPVGRLDRMTTGVLLFTNDGDMAKKLLHPKHGVKKIYHVVLDKNLIKTDMIKIVEGVELEDGVVDVDKISYVGDGADKKEIGIELHVGKNRIVRRLFEALGYNVTKLDRVSFAGLTKKNIQRGEWRFLSEKEISFLKMLK